VILCTPIAPARTGNGLAMRAGVLLDALAGLGPVDVVIVPVAGSLPLDWARAAARSVQVLGPVDAADARAHTDRQLGDAWLRTQLSATAPLPRAALGAPASLAADVGLPDDPVDTVVGFRLVLAPFTAALARRVGATRVVLDADDDDVALLRAVGADAEADATERLARAWLPEFDEVWVASAPDAEGLRARFRVDARVVPNAVRLPAVVPPAPIAPPRLLFVGNLTYGPNLDAATVLAREVLPRVRVARPDATLALVGPHDPGALDGLAADPAVHVAGRVADVGPEYAAATVAVVPLRHGAGTRIKVLEAAAYGRPVVASSAAVAGLDLVSGVHAIVAEGADATSAAVVDLLADPDRVHALTAAARALVEERYSVAAVAATVRDGVRSNGPGPTAADAPLVRRVLWNSLELHAPEAVRTALDAVLPTATHDFPAGETLRYDVEPAAGGAFVVFEAGDRLGRVPSAPEARDLVHARFHRRVFERASRAGWLRVHGALVEIGGARVLCTGPEGAGKSTLALRLLLDGFTVLGDESVVVRGRDVVAVARPLHCKPGAEVAVPELAALDPLVPAIDGIRIVDPGRLGRPWSLGIASLDHVVVLTTEPGEGPVGLVAVPQTQVLPDLVDALFPVVESKPTVLRALTTALAGVGCHRLGRGTPAAMEHALRDLG